MKLIDLLVKELPRRGGWPEGAKYCHLTQYDRHCLTIVFPNKQIGTEDGQIISNIEVVFPGLGHLGDELYDCTVTAEQYESALAASEGWMDWHGGKCPVDSDAIVEVKYRNTNPRQYNNDRAGDFDWAHAGSSSDIIAYRLHKPAANSRANDDRMEQDLNECIGQDVDVPEWNGDGLPPVGVECEFKCATGEWVAVEITAIARNGVCFVERGKNGENYVSSSIEFRPLRTEADKKRQVAAQALCDSCGGTGKVDESLGFGIMWFDVYDAIAAGKIPGVKLEGK